VRQAGTPGASRNGASRGLDSPYTGRRLLALRGDRLCLPRREQPCQMFDSFDSEKLATSRPGPWRRPVGQPSEPHATRANLGQGVGNGAGRRCPDPTARFSTASAARGRWPLFFTACNSNLRRDRSPWQQASRGAGRNQGVWQHGRRTFGPSYASCRS
jgi:hypothetical protein